nr:MAG TPA: hypothetical protein [Caudoviricetes sp.]
MKLICYNNFKIYKNALNRQNKLLYTFFCKNLKNVV